VTTPASGGGPSALRLGGLALIGVAVVAAIIGLASMATGGDPVPTAAPSPAAPSPEPPLALPPAEPVPPDDGTVPVPPVGEPAPGEPAPGGAPPPPVPGDPGAPDPGAPAPQPAPGGAPEAQGAPGAPAPPGAAGEPVAPPPPPSDGVGGSARAGDAPGDTSAVRVPVRVYNNSTISGLAARAAEDFRRAGWPIDEVGNYPHGVIPTTTVYYRPGTDEEAPARALGTRFGMRVNPRFEGLQSATPGVIVIVTNDYGR
jgi:hypothetical protein